MKLVGEHIRRHPLLPGVYGAGIGITGALDYQDAGDGVHVVLIRPFAVQSRGRLIESPRGFRTNFASIPWLFRRLIPCFGRHNAGAVIHDFIYENAGALGISKDEADRIFLDLNLRMGVEPWKARLEYLALWIGGGPTWRACRRRERRRRAKSASGSKAENQVR